MDQPPRSDPDAGAVAGEDDADPSRAEVVLQTLLERYDADPDARAGIEAEGEDLAEGGEILVSAAAEAMLGPTGPPVEPVSFEVSGVTIDAHLVGPSPSE